MPAAKKTAVTKPAAKKVKPAAKKLTLVKPESTPIKAYEPHMLPVTPYFEIPFSFNDESELYEALDVITLAAEGGKLTYEGWLAQLFKTRADFHAFLEHLEGYDDCYRINDRWWYALALIGGSQNCEEGFIHTEDIARSIEEEAVKSGQL